MAFTSLLFLLFLALVCAAACLVPRRVRYVWLLLCSWGFYLYSSAAPNVPAGLTLALPENFAENLLRGLPKLLLLCGYTLFAYLCALGLGLFKKPLPRKLLLGLALAALLGLLCFFKYADFTLELDGRVLRIHPLMPLGLSYYILQSAGYLIDVYALRVTPEKNPLRYALFVSFFPGIMVGPINRAARMLPQYALPAAFSYDRVSGGLFRVLWGIFKKMVIADNLALFINSVYREAAACGGPLLALAALLFIYQLYADFSGSCDIAIGAARMLGFDFAENFNRPFSAKTFTDIWRRWHLSLTSWFRDYLYIPLGGSRVGKIRFALNLMLVFLLSGMWHGATWHYALWGGVTGLIMLATRFLGDKKDRLAARVPLYRARFVRGAAQRVFTYLLFAFTFIFFAAGLYGAPLSSVFGGLFAGWDILKDPALFFSLLEGNGLTLKRILVLGASVLLAETVEKLALKNGGTVAGWIRGRWFFIRWPLYYLLLGAILFFGVFGNSAFIYAQY